MRIIILFPGLCYWVSASAGVSAWVPFDSDGGHISIPVTLNGVETRAILDSGSTLVVTIDYKRSLLHMAPPMAE